VTTRAVLRTRATRLAGALAMTAVAATACGGSTGVPGPPSAYLGTVVDRPVPPGIANLPLTTDAGRPTSLGAWRGQVVVLADFLTLCQETCPLTTGNLLMMDRAVTAAGLGRRVRFAELTVDPERDTPELLSHYVTAFDPSFLGLSGDADATARVAKEFKIIYQKQPGSTPETYTMDHSAGTFVFDPEGRLRLYVGHGQDPEFFAHDLKLLLPGAAS